MPKLETSITPLFKEWLRQALDNIALTKETGAHMEETLQSIWKSLQGWEIVANNSNELIARANIRAAKKSIHLIITTSLNVKPENNPDWTAQ